MGTSQVQQKPRSSGKALHCSQDQLQPSKGGFAPRNPESTRPWIRTAAPCHSLGGELQVRLAVTDFAKPKMSSASAPMLCEWTGHTEKVMLHFSVYRDWFSELWTGLGGHSGSLWCSPAPQLLLPYLQLHWQSSSCVSSLIQFQQSHSNLFTEARPQAGPFFQIQLKRFLL